MGSFGGKCRLPHLARERRVDGQGPEFLAATVPLVKRKEPQAKKCLTMMLVKGTVVQLASMPGTHARCMTLLPLPRVCPGRGKLAFTSGSTDPKFIACTDRLTICNMLEGANQKVWMALSCPEDFQL